MKFTAFNGSPAGKNSATHRMVSAFLRGVEHAGAETENVLLCEHSIALCQGCFSCWFQTPGQCVHQDDMAALLDSYQSADVVCFASPVYSWNMTALLKNFIDRLIPLKSPRLTEEQGRFDMADAQRRPQQYVTMANCGFPGEHNFSIIQAAFSCCQPSLEIYRNCGKLLRSKQPSVQAVVSEYLSAVEQAGYEFAADGAVCPATLERLSMPLMRTPDYVKFLGMG